MSDAIALARQLALLTPGHDSRYHFQRALTAADQTGARTVDEINDSCSSYLRRRLDAEHANARIQPFDASMLKVADEAVAATRKQLASGATRNSLGLSK
jgi:hypothetical protein